ncbi:hypothetical protein A2999_01250 [Candidatus Wolfebacteria bacterium RIFCSPLOWO2_01_FULL_38_11]|uniref:Tetratricopeptide repeat protein n=2 Tax=Candidatus Wolfeibacteriota TaxID=1752735 RepID=A0A0G0IG04_9BACT|nr:MAG: hypothetical protein US36_C0004G0010 [Candidatus Wolfebacteria bacterium GW2011_GWC1_37_10]OGM91021.1 MAG: hypothetical protein A2999_01250 [Candidatus Wolfebacteria bacterium RIFCSPLOWO2_01_FULL_38_11]
MSKLFIKQFIVILLIILAIFFIIFGSLLPLMKSRRFIHSLNSAQFIKTLGEFKENFDRPLKFYSPIGDEEIAKFLSGNILSGIYQKEQPEAVARELVLYIEPYMFKNNVRHLLALGQMYSVLWQKSGREDDFIKAENYYQKALSIGPKLPPLLYGMFDLYQLKGDKEKLRETAGQILKYWPEDKKIEKYLN